MDLDIPPRFSSGADRATHLLSKYRVLVAVAVVGAVAVVLNGGVPRSVRVLGLGVIYGVIPAYLVGLLIIEKLIGDNREEVIELDVGPDGIIARSWQVPPAAWEDRSRGERPALDPDEGAKAVVTDFEHLDDVGRISVEGANPELSDPVSMVARDGKLEEIEETLIGKAEQLDKLEATVRSKALDIQRDNVHALLGAVEKGTQMDAGSVEDAVGEMDVDTSVTRSDEEEETRSYAFESRGSPAPEQNGDRDLTEVDL